jgi:DNA-binding MarR family transcriptional regulator
MTRSPQLAFGPTLAFAEQTLTEQLHQHLAERHTAPATWYALQLITIRGPRLARDALSHALASSRTLDADSTRDLLARLEAEGLIRGDAELDLTAEGQALHRSLREFVTGSTAQLLSQFDADDIDTTMRTLQAITKHVAEELATGRVAPTV